MSDEQVEEQRGAAPKQIVLTVTARGNFIAAGDLDPKLLEQMSAPEAREKIRKLYKQANGTGRREIRRGPEIKPERRDFTHAKPPGMTSAEFRKLRRAKFREWTKSTLKMQRRMHGKPTGDEPNHGHSSESSVELANGAA